MEFDEQTSRAILTNVILETLEPGKEIRVAKSVVHGDDPGEWCVSLDSVTYENYYAVKVKRLSPNYKV